MRRFPRAASQCYALGLPFMWPHVKIDCQQVQPEHLYFLSRIGGFREASLMMYETGCDKESLTLGTQLSLRVVSIRRKEMCVCHWVR